MIDLRARASRNDKLLLASLVLLVGVPVFALAGWLIWSASAFWPWLMSFGTVLVVLFLLKWPLEHWLKRQNWFKHKAGTGWFRELLLKFLTFYLPVLVIVGVNDLDHDKSLASNLREYVLTIATFLVAIIVVETIFEAVRRWWKGRHKREKFEP